MFSFIKTLKKFFGKNPISREKLTRKVAFPNKPVEVPKVDAPVEKTHNEKTCPICGKSFVPKCNHQKFCSRKCYKKEKTAHECEKRKSPNQEKTCLQCGKSFETSFTHKKFCSHECQLAFNAAKKKRAPQIEKTCLQCGKSFVTSYPHQKFCSHECHEKFHNAKKTSKVTFSDKPVESKKKYEEKTCPHCGKTFKTYSPHQKFCSTDCRRTAYARTCPTCGKSFVAEINGQKYCSYECRMARYKETQTRQLKEPIDKVCPTCGEIFWTKKPNQKYCSAKCGKQTHHVKKKKPDEEILSCKPPKKSLQQWMDEAAQCGMSYGKYRAAIERLGHTFEELKIS